MEHNCVCVCASFLDQVGTKEASCSVPSSPVTLETSSSSSGAGGAGGEMDLPAVRATNITDLINESYEVSGTSVSWLSLMVKSVFTPGPLEKNQTLLKSPQSGPTSGPGEKRLGSLSGPLFF